MRTVRRRAESADLRWTAVGADRQYRVAVRDEDTGKRQIVYEGFRTECRLPAELRLTANQLTFWVGSRHEQDAGGRYLRCQDYMAVPRLGDDFRTLAPDLLVGSETSGASGYRLRVRDAEGGAVLVEISRGEPVFLLPAGRLSDATCEWAIQPRLRNGFGRPDWKAVTPEMITAAQTRAERLILTKDESRRVLGVVDGEWPPGDEASLPDAPPRPASLILAVRVTASPTIAPDPSPASVVASQWINASGTGAVQMVSAALSRRNIAGWFFLDLAAVDALGNRATETLIDRLRREGHHLGVTLGESVWDAVSPVQRGTDIAEVVKGRLDMFRSLTAGNETAPVRLSVRDNVFEWMTGCRDAGVCTILAPRRTLLSGPRWMHWRTSPFMGMDGLVVAPSAMMLSTPAHPRDQVVRHPLNTSDGLASASAGETFSAMAASSNGARLMIAETDPLKLLAQARRKRRQEADAWNATVRQDLPGWWSAGWSRSSAGYDVIAGVSEIQTQMLDSLTEAMIRTRLPWAEPSNVCSAQSARGWLNGSMAYDGLMEQRRGPRLVRASAVRSYGNALRLGLLSERG